MSYDDSLELPPHPVTVTTRIIPFVVGNPYKPSFVTVTGRGVDHNDTVWISSASLDVWSLSTTVSYSLRVYHFFFAAARYNLPKNQWPPNMRDFFFWDVCARGRADMIHDVKYHHFWPLLTWYGYCIVMNWNITVVYTLHVQLHNRASLNKGIVRSGLGRPGFSSLDMPKKSGPSSTTQLFFAAKCNYTLETWAMIMGI